MNVSAKVSLKAQQKMTNLLQLKYKNTNEKDDDEHVSLGDDW